MHIVNLELFVKCANDNAGMCCTLKERLRQQFFGEKINSWLLFVYTLASSNVIVFVFRIQYTETLWFYTTIIPKKYKYIINYNTMFFLNPDSRPNNAVKSSDFHF